LAGRIDDDGLKIADASPERVPLARDGTAASAEAAAATPQPESLPAGAPLQAVEQELDRLGVPREGRSLYREGTQYLFRAVLPWKGARRQYTGLGDSPVAAIRQVIAQIQLDRSEQ
jgi:hypothetical protein